MFVISVTKTLSAVASRQVGRVISNLLDMRGKVLKDQLQLQREHLSPSAHRRLSDMDLNTERRSPA